VWSIFAEVVSRGDTYMFSPDITEQAARAAWFVDGPAGPSVTYVATLDGAVVATALLKPNAPGLGDHVANAGWMVAPRFSGRGVGRALAEHVIADARRLGYEGMQFNAVVATNVSAIALWESLGFSVVGTVPNAFRHRSEGLVSVHVMYRDLSAVGKRAGWSRT